MLKWRPNLATFSIFGNSGRARAFFGGATFDPLNGRFCVEEVRGGLRFCACTPPCPASASLVAEAESRCFFFFCKAPTRLTLLFFQILSRLPFFFLPCLLFRLIFVSNEMCACAIDPYVSSLKLVKRDLDVLVFFYIYVYKFVFLTAPKVFRSPRNLNLFRPTCIACRRGLTNCLPFCLAVAPPSALSFSGFYRADLTLSVFFFPFTLFFFFPFFMR